jgi:hypothetical protein
MEGSSVDPYWSKLLNRRFKPAEAAVITGVSPELQRKWIERYFKKRADSEGFYHWRLESEGDHSRYTWEGVQALALFGEIASDVGVEVAKKALGRSSRGTLLHDFHVDWRERHEGTDICLSYGFDRPESDVITTTLANVLSQTSSPVWSGRFYIFNYSAFQRRVAARAIEALELGAAAASA